MKTLPNKPVNQSRRGTTTVELSVVIGVTLLLLFGIFEYARYTHLLEVTNNAAREGARFAVVRTGDGTTEADIVAEVNRRMAGRQKEFNNFTVEVTSVDPDTGETTGDEWHETAFGNAIAIRITGQYKPLLPDFLYTSNVINFDVTHMMASESN